MGKLSKKKTVKEEIVAELPEFEMPEETPEERRAGIQAQIDQMERMIEENHRMIALGDDVEARKNMINVLTNEIANRRAEL